MGFFLCEAVGILTGKVLVDPVSPGLDEFAASRDCAEADFLDVGQ